MRGGFRRLSSSLGGAGGTRSWRHLGDRRGGGAAVARGNWRLLYAKEQTRLAAHQSLRVAEQAAATGKITSLAGDLARRGKALESSLAESNSRLARLDLGKARRHVREGAAKRPAFSGPPNR